VEISYENLTSFFISSRRLEVSRVELLLQVGAFCVAVGALIASTFSIRNWTKWFFFFFGKGNRYIDFKPKAIQLYTKTWHQELTLKKTTS